MVENGVKITMYHKIAQKIQIFFVAHMTPNECLTEVSSHILNFGRVGGMRRTRRLPRRHYPADFTNLRLREPPFQKFFWFLNFTFPFPIREFTWYIRFGHFCSFPNIAMHGLLLFSQWTLQMKQGNSLIKKTHKISQTVKQCRLHPPAMPPNFKKNGSLLHKIPGFEVSMPC